MILISPKFRLVVDMDCISKEVRLVKFFTIIDDQPLGPLPIGIPVSPPSWNLTQRHRPVPAPPWPAPA